ncbi:phage tail tape measure protein [Lysinibacillus pakistanensis]|uniref:phage tail tape measure protein n=1 Tax=Lysinibacillus pakistanensis TaxID=759811 RepID=UPI003D296F57
MSILRDMYVSMRFRDQATSSLRNVERLVDRIENNFRSLGSRVDTSTSGFRSMAREVGRLETELSNTRTEMQGLQNRIDESEREMESLRNEVNRLNSAASESNSIFTGMAGKVAAVAGTLGGLALGASVISTAVEMDTAFSRLEARTGATKAELKELEGVAKDVFQAGFGENITQVADDVSTLGAMFKNLKGSALTEVAKGAATIAQTWDAESKEVGRTIQSMTSNFEGLSETKALDLMTHAFQKTGDYSDDLLDTFNEYSVHFSKLGLSAEEFTGILISGAENGAWNMDKVGDAVKEFGIRAIDGSKGTKEGFAAIGLNADKMAEKFTAGGETANNAFAATLAGLATMKDPVEQNAAGVALFGTMWEDLREDVVLSMADTTSAVAGFEGSTERAAEALQNNFGSRTTKVWRDLKLSMVEAFQSDEMQNFLGSVMSDIESAVPSIKNAFSSMAEVITNNVEPAYAGFKTGVGWIIDNKDLVVSALTGVAGGFALLKGITFVKTALDLYKASTFASTFATHGFNAALRANPIGLVVTAIGFLIGAGVYLYQNWDTVKLKAGQLWGTVKEKFAGIKQAVSDFVQPAIGWFESIGQKWNDFKSSLSNFKVPEWVSKIGGAIGKAAGAVGNFISGSHATGLERVPYDGYIAELHRDETVLTAQQSSALRSAGMLSQNSDGTPELNMGGGGTTQQAPNTGGGGHQFIFQITGDNPLDIAQKVREVVSDLLGEELQIM